MQDLYITKIRIKKVRHLENIDIELSAEEKKHLIITGKNGSGKTSLITSLQKVFEDWGTLELEPNGQYTVNNEANVNHTGIEVFGSVPSYDINLMYRENIFETLPADRKLILKIPQVIESVASHFEHSEMFVKYMLHLNYQMMYAKTNNDTAEAEKVQKWFDRFINALREIYDCPALQLIHNSKDLSFKIVMPEREPFGLNEMADGYSSFLRIVIELMMKMEKKGGCVTPIEY
jgi:energy-coupling factor transporter ATP-binding protein EcfA2